jgi:nucleoside triphosphate diphosphatase
VTQSNTSNEKLDKLRQIVSALRDPENGCPWDIEQTFSSIAPYAIEEAYEVFDAVSNENWANLEKELGDLLLQTVYQSQIASEKGLFDLGSVISKVSQKMIDRHPHVFEESSPERTINEQMIEWESVKEKERSIEENSGVLAGIALALPALTRSFKIQQRASRVGFDWKSINPVYDKVFEEIKELKNASISGTEVEIKEELGDLLFSIVNLSRHLSIEPEDALRSANLKFIKRFDYIEKVAIENLQSLNSLSEAQWESQWEEAKKLEKL